METKHESLLLKNRKIFKLGAGFAITIPKSFLVDTDMLKEGKEYDIVVRLNDQTEILSLARRSVLTAYNNIMAQAGIVPTKSKSVDLRDYQYSVQASHHGGITLMGVQ